MLQTSEKNVEGSSSENRSTGPKTMTISSVESVVRDNAKKSVDTSVLETVGNQQVRTVADASTVTIKNTPAVSYYFAYIYDYPFLLMNLIHIIVGLTTLLKVIKSS